MGCSDMELKNSAIGRPSSSSMILNACITALPLHLQAHMHMIYGCNAALPGDAAPLEARKCSGRQFICLQHWHTFRAACWHQNSLSEWQAVGRLTISSAKEGTSSCRVHSSSM